MLVIEIKAFCSPKISVNSHSGSIRYLILQHTTFKTHFSEQYSIHMSGSILILLLFHLFEIAINHIYNRLFLKYKYAFKLTCCFIGTDLIQFVLYNGLTFEV